jgi:hypothetical protein
MQEAQEPQPLLESPRALWGDLVIIRSITIIIITRFIRPHLPTFTYNCAIVVDEAQMCSSSGALH